MMLTVGSTLLYVTRCWFETRDPASPEEEKETHQAKKPPDEKNLVLNKLRELIEDEAQVKGDDQVAPKFPV